MTGCLWLAQHPMPEILSRSEADWTIRPMPGATRLARPNLARPGRLERRDGTAFGNRYREHRQLRLLQQAHYCWCPALAGKVGYAVLQADAPAQNASGIVSFHKPDD